MGLTIRPFVSGQDEATWVGIRNQARRDDEDFTPDTIEDVKRWEDAPWVGVRVRLMAEADCVPVARVSAETDKMRTDRKGFVTGPDVVSEYRHRGIGTALMQQALSSLRSAGLETAVVRTFDDPASRGFLESLGFSVVRRFCWMRRTLATVPSGVGEARDAEVVALGSTEEDLAMLCRLSNEAFEDHYDHTPGTVAEWKFATKKIDESGAVTYRTLARLAGEPAGFLLYGVDPKENDYLEKKRGDLRSIGVLKRFRGRGDNWQDELALYLLEGGGGEEVFTCPVAPDVDIAYALNRDLAGKQATELTGHDRLVLFFESDLNAPNAVGAPAADMPEQARHFREWDGEPGNNIVYLNGSTTSQAASQSAAEE